MKRFIPWFGAIAILVIVFGTMYGVAQQVLRYDANMPQIQLAEDTAASLNSGHDPALQVHGSVNINSSLAPFVVIYDKKGNVVATSGYLNGKYPKAPYGILLAAQNVPFHTITWQPQSDVRIAAVTVAANKYYVLSGRSLREVEANETKVLLLSFAGGVASLIVLGATYLLYKRL